MVCVRGTPTRPDSPESEEDDGGLWRKQQRESIKKGAARPPIASDLGAGLVKASQELQLPPLKNKLALDIEAKRVEIDAREDADLAAKRTRLEAQAHTSACWEDLISFLELHKLPGAYALAFSAFGIEDLSSLLLLDDAGLSSLLGRCNIDAMDEILLLEALRNSKIH